MAEVTLTEEQSLILAKTLIPINNHVFCMDLDYATAAGIEMVQQAGRQEAMSIINAEYSQAMTDILRAKGQALLLLVDYAEKLKEVDELKKKLTKEQQHRENVKKLFM